MFFFFCNWTGARPGTWCPMQNAYTAFNIVHIAQTGPERKGTLATDLKGAGTRAKNTPLSKAN